MFLRILKWFLQRCSAWWALCNCSAPDVDKKVKILDDSPKPPKDSPTTPSDGYPPPGADINDTELGRRIRQDHLNQTLANDPRHLTIDDVLITAYYGTYNDCAVVIFKGYGGATVVNTTIVAGIMFTYSSGEIEIVVWNAGQFYKLQEAYDLGLFTRESFVNIARLHTEACHYLFTDAYHYLDGSRAGLSAGLEERIKQNYLRNLNSLDSGVADDVWVEAYYGTYNGFAAVIMGDSGLDCGNAERVVDIDGILFRYNNENIILLGHPSGFTALQTAYDFGGLTRENLRNIADRHNNRDF